MSRINYIAPSPQSGYILNPMRGYLSVIEPEETENIVENPSVEFATTNWTAVGGTIALSTTWQTSGANSLLVTPAAGVNDGAYYLQSTTINTRYTWSLDFRGTKGIKYSIRVYGVTGAATLVTSGFISTGFLQNLRVGFDTGANTSVRAYVEKAGHTSVSPFYVDSMQIEAKNYATTYSDGDKPGSMWRGQPHASRSSRGISSTGGRIRRLDQYGFQVLSISGLDMPPIQPSSTDYAIQNGAAYQGYRATTRSITIVGIVGGARLDVLQHRKHKLMELFKPNAFSQPITFRYQAFDGNRPVGDEVEFYAVYAEGLEGVGNDNYQERLAIRFMLHNPLIYSVHTVGTAIGFQDLEDLPVTVPATAPFNAHYVLGRINGKWKELGNTDFAPPGSGLVSAINKMKMGPDGKLYIAGSFTKWNNIANLNYIARYNFSSELWEDFAGAGVATGPVSDFCWGPDGALYVVGDFHNWNFSINHVAKLMNATWTAVGNPDAVGAVVTWVSSCAVTHDNRLFVGGTFTDFAGVAGSNALVYWDVSWKPVWATAATTTIWTMAVGPDDNIYASYYHVSGPGTPYHVSRIVARTLVTTELGTGLNFAALTVTFSPSGELYIAGLFTTAGGNPVNRMAKLDGTDWVPVGDMSLFTGTFYVKGMAFDSLGILYMISVSDQAEFLSHPWAGQMARWNEFSWASLDISIGWTLGPEEIVIDGANNIFIASAVPFTGALPAGVTSVVNSGSMDAVPTFIINGPGTLYTIFNETTGDKLWFDLTLQAGEKAILVLGDNPVFLSTFGGMVTGAMVFHSIDPYDYSVVLPRYVTGPGRGDLFSTILPGSNTSTFRLVPGINRISCLRAGTVDVDNLNNNDTSIKVYYKPTYWGVQDASGVSK
jgi:hypothetical protein